MTYVGPSLDKLMHMCFGNPYDHTIANFSVSAYQELGVTCIDGRALMFAYSDLHTANISTLCDPHRHVPGMRVPCVICDAEGVSLGVYTRSVFNGRCDIVSFCLDCGRSKAATLNFLYSMSEEWLQVI